MNLFLTSCSHTVASKLQFTDTGEQTYELLVHFQFNISRESEKGLQIQVKEIMFKTAIKYYLQ